MRRLVCFLVLGTGWLQAQTTLSNKRAIENPCSAVWPAALRVMVENDFRPTVLDKDSGIATFAYQKVIPINSKWGQRKAADEVLTQFVQVPAYGRGYFGAVILELRVESASLLFTEQDGGCDVTIKITYALSIKSAGWHIAESNFAFETRLLDNVESNLHRGIKEQIGAGKV